MPGAGAVPEYRSADRTPSSSPAILFAASAAMWFNLGGTRAAARPLCGGSALAWSALIVINMRWPVIDVTFAKGQKLANEIFVKWNSFSRIAVAPEQRRRHELIVIDADASTGIANFDFDHLTEREKQDLLLPGPGVSLSGPPRRQDADHRTRRRLGRRARHRIRQQGHHRRRDQPDHRDHHHAEAVPAT